MNLLFDAEDFKSRPRGIVKTTLRLYEACRSLVPDLGIVGITRKPIATELPPGIHSVLLKPNLPRVLWRTVMFNAYMAFHGCTALHFPANGRIPPLITNRGLNVIMTLHDIVQMVVPGHFSSQSGLDAFRERIQRDIDRSRVVFTVSENSKKDIMNAFRLRSEPIVLYPAPTLTPDNYDPIMDMGRTGGYFLYSGGYDRRKGLEPLLRVFMGLHRDRNLTSKLYLTGSRSYYSKTFKRLIDEATAMNVAKELDYVSDRELIELMRNAKGLIYPSFYEGFGLPPLEAMSVGCPVITTPYSSIPEVCGKAALYVRPDDAREFGDAIIALERNGRLRSELIVSGKAQSGRFSWNRTAAAFLKHGLQRYGD